jgi:hypothetical protein
VRAILPKTSIASAHGCKAPGGDGGTAGNFNRATSGASFSAGEPKIGVSYNQRAKPPTGIIAMLKVELAPLVILLMLMTTPSVADVTSELARCQLEVERLYPAPPDKGARNWADRAANLQKRAEGIETCLRAAGYRLTAECSAPLTTYESCMKIADQITRGPSANQHRGADWNKICLDNEWDVRTQRRLSSDCYQSGSWWRRWIGQ